MSEDDNKAGDSGQTYGHDDPINYLRAVRGEEVQSSDNLRRLDSDDDTRAFIIEEQQEYYDLDGGEDLDQKQPADTTPKNVVGEQRSTTAGTAGRFPPMPEARRAYRPQSSGHAPQPPARERPDPNSAWPYRETLSFTRSLIFYGAGTYSV